GHISTFALTREADDKFSTTLDSVTEGLDYWFEAGDDSTEQSVAHIRVVPRPEVVEATARVEPPAYVSKRNSNLLDLTEGPANAVSGATITVSIRSSKPIAMDSEKGPCGLRRDDETLILLQIERDDDQRLVATFPLAEGINFRVELHDTEGFSNRGSTSYTIRALPDVAPTVTILSPQAVAELTPHGAVELAIRAEDDFGIRTLGLEIEDPHGGDRRTVDITSEARLSPIEQGVEADVSYVWHVESLGATPGDVFVYVATAVDNRGGDADSGQTGRSSAMRLKFVSDGELELRIREDLAQIENRLRQAANDQSENRDRTALLTHTDLSTLTTKESESSTGVANFEVRLARQLRETSSRLDGASHRLALNGIGDRDTTTRLASAGAALDSVALGPLAAASVSLERARSSNEATIQQQEIKSTIQAQDSAVDQIRTVVRELSQWGAFQGVLSRARELLDRQSALQSGANEMSRSLLGKTVESLAPEEATALKRLQREQDQLAGDVEQQLARMQQLTETMKDKDPAGAESLEAGLRAARALDAVKHARAAAEAIQGNRTAAAAMEQKAAGQALHKMLDALRDRETRELAELRKRIDRAEEEVSALIEEQTQIRTASVEASKLGLPTEPFNALAESESTLERNARILGDEIVEMERAASAGRFVRDSATPMHSAALALSQREGDTAVTRQADAIDLLRKALDDLQAIARRGEEEEFKRTLDHIEEELTSLLAEQTEINRGISGLRDVVRPSGHLGRTEAREATRLSRTQGELRTRVDDMLPDLRQAAVYQWALRRVVHWMDVSRTALEERQVDDELLATTDRIVREFRKLLGAISDTRDLPMSSEFTEADGAGSGDGQQAKGVSVPTVAELIVLRTMQNDINTRTRDVATATGEGEPSESDLRRLQAIGEDQAEVRRLTELVTKKSQSRPPG
ncbi:MAG: hypothetical protein HYR83_12300, partial [Planctomycetes bacterium]|nr:hypothetical protein [Planctomycetota bacterium]